MSAAKNVKDDRHIREASRKALL